MKSIILALLMSTSSAYAYNECPKPIHGDPVVRTCTDAERGRDGREYNGRNADGSPKGNTPSNPKGGEPKKGKDNGRNVDGSPKTADTPEAPKPDKPNDPKGPKDKGKKDKHDNNGFGNGDQDAPGNSLDHNGAENDQNGKGNGKNHKD